MNIIPHISVCICTFKRPEMLEKLFINLFEQQTYGLFTYSIVVVDNDFEESAREITEQYAENSKIQINYHVEKEQNISLARNKAVANSTGKYLGFIDDDEYPCKTWLINMLKAIRRYESDGVLGPVIPHYEVTPPKWVVKGRFFERGNHNDGEILEWKNTRTGNALIQRAIFQDKEKWFDPILGSGGEDRDFFRRQINNGAKFVWCEDAMVYEMIPQKRWQKKVMLKRALLRGMMAFKSETFNYASLLKSFFACVAYAIMMPIFLICGQHVFMKYMIKLCDHLGKIMAFCRIELVREKYI